LGKKTILKTEERNILKHLMISIAAHYVN